MKRFCFVVVLLFSLSVSFAQNDTAMPVQTPPADTADVQLRIMDLSPFFTLHVDSSLSYQLQINKSTDDYFWYLKNAPIGLRINKDNGLISFKAEKAYFLSGKLKYDQNYKVLLGVQNRNDPTERVDTSFNIIFYNTEIVSSQVKPTISGTVWMEEGETASFKVLCDNGSFPIENIITLTSMPISQYQIVQKCGEEFTWTPNFDFVRETDSAKVRIVTLSFIGSTKSQMRDTATVRLVVKDALNYPLALQEYNQTVRSMNRYVLELKYTFLLLDKKLKKTKSYRTTFDLTSATTSLTGTVMSTSSGSDAQRTGKILPSVGLALVPIKEAAVPNKNVDQNQASLVRTNIKRLEYMLDDNQLLGSKDPDIIRKNNKLKDELKQAQLQLMEVPMEFTNELTEKELDKYFNSPRVNKKYRLKSRR